MRMIVPRLRGSFGQPRPLTLWPGQIEPALGTKDIAVKTGDPLPPARCDVEVPDGGLDMRRNVVPVKLRISVREIGRRGVAKLPIHSDLFELMVERVRLAQIMRVAELSDEIGSAHQQAFLVPCVVRLRRRGKPREFDG